MLSIIRHGNVANEKVWSGKTWGNLFLSVMNGDIPNGHCPNFVDPLVQCITHASKLAKRFAVPSQPIIHSKLYNTDETKD